MYHLSKILQVLFENFSKNRTAVLRALHHVEDKFRRSPYFAATYSPDNVPHAGNVGLCTDKRSKKMSHPFLVRERLRTQLLRGIPLFVYRGFESFRDTFPRRWHSLRSVGRSRPARTFEFVGRREARRVKRIKRHRHSIKSKRTKVDEPADRHFSERPANFSPARLSSPRSILCFLVRLLRAYRGERLFDRKTWRQIRSGRSVHLYLTPTRVRCSILDLIGSFSRNRT